ncbi:MAG: hypothetical protein V8S95_08210 [Odoribacter sp.]
MQEQLAKYAPGNSVQLAISRDGKEKVIEVVLQKAHTGYFSF